MLAASLANSDLPPIIDAEQVAALLHCSKGQIEDLAELGRLPATKFGRGVVFVTAQVVYSVLQQSSSNAAIAFVLKGTSRGSPFFVRSRKIVRLGIDI